MRLDESLADSLDEIDDEKIIEALENLADSTNAGDELSEYSSVADIEQDNTISDSKRVRLKSKAYRRRGFPTR
ncbi:hypothetical protein [Halovenus salina]|uniref:Uncharacterized protein n=2 Tax=Halovenus salina TaxID=1510225 RepID=A0ABD5W2H1_9EURY